MSHQARLQNAANAKRSTGPRTEAGKAVSRMNARKHGFCSTHVTEDEDLEEVERARGRWFADLAPQGEAQESLADLAFRQRRRLERALAAEDAATAARVAEVRVEIGAEHARFLDVSTALFDSDPIDGVAHLRATADGIGLLLRTLDDYDDDVDRHLWCPARTAKLAAIEGAREPAADDVLDRTTALFDRRLSDERVILESRGLDDDPAARRSRIAAELRLNEIDEDLKKFKKMLKDRIGRAKTWLREERVDSQAEEAELVRAAVDEAKFDDSDAARLLRRHISDAQRDHLRALREFHALRRPSPRRDVPAPEPAPPHFAEPDAPTAPPPPPTAFAAVSATPIRNEPISPRDDYARRKARPRPPAELKARRRR